MPVTAGRSSAAGCLVAYLATAIAGGDIFAQAPKLGVEIQVNSYTTDRQERASAAMDDDGDFVVVWESLDQDGNVDGVFAQRFGATGARKGVEFQVNAYTTGSSPTLGIQDQPGVAMDADGKFVVVWRSFSQDGNSYGVFGRRYDSAGAAIGADFQVNSFTTGQQSLPAVAMTDDGAFVVAWQSNGQDGNSFGILARRFDSLGDPQAVEFRVNSFTVSAQEAPAVAISVAGDFAIAWESDFQEGVPPPGVFAQRYDSSGSPQASEFHVNTYTPDNQVNPALAIAADGRFMVVWESTHQDGAAGGVFAQRFGSSGSPEGVELQVNTFTNGNQYNSRIEVDTEGDFVVVWTSNEDGNSFGIFAQRFDSAGARLGVNFQVNTYTPGSQTAPALGMDAEGGFVVAWESSGQDGSFEGIFAQRFGAEFASLDVDANGAFTPLTDALLILRYAFGFTGPTLTAGAVGPGCTRCTAGAIESYIASIVTVLDVDDNGAFQPLTDALLVLRWAFGFTGSTLVTGAVGAGCMRCDAPAIETYLATLIG